MNEAFEWKVSTLSVVTHMSSPDQHVGGESDRNRITNRKSSSSQNKRMSCYCDLVTFNVMEIWFYTVPLTNCVHFY